MGTSPTTLASSVPTFNGSSTYAAQLQQTITHAVDIASIPLNQLNTNVTTLQGQSSELSLLQTDFESIQTAIGNLTTASNGGGLAVSVGDSTVATATLNSAAAISAGTYTLNVINAGSSTTSLSNQSLPTVADPSSTSISISSSFTLTVNGSTFTVNPASNSLNSLAQAINSSGGGVSATVINLGSSSAPNYRLSLQSTALGNIPIQLNDGSQDLLSTLSTGVQAQYQVNGQPATPISSDSSSITLAPGLTINLAGVGQTTISVSQNSTGAANAISAFVTAYNAAADELSFNRGTTQGVLTGQSVVFTLQQTLKSISSFSGGTGSLTSLADLGLTFDGTGHLAFNQSQFSTVASSNPGDLAAFLGTGTDSGFLASASAALSGLTNATNGLFESQQTVIQDRITADRQEISDTQTRIATMQSHLTAQMSAADALLASLEAQSTFMTQLFQAQNAIANSGG